MRTPHHTTLSWYSIADSTSRHKLWLSTVGTTLDLVKIAIFYVVVKYVLRRIIHAVVVPVIERGGRAVDVAQAGRIKTLASLLNSVFNYILIFITGIMVLRAFNLDPIPLLTTASVAGLAVGFGAQKLVKDVISGFFILLENQYAIGDYVTIGTATGTVEDVGMRTTRIRDDVGKLYILSNGDITQVCNQSRGAVASFVEVGIAAASDVAAATQVINTAGEALFKEREDLSLASAPSVQGLSSFDGAKVTLRVACPVRAPGKTTDAQVALRSAIHSALAAASIPAA